MRNIYWDIWLFRLVSNLSTVWDIVRLFLNGHYLKNDNLPFALCDLISLQSKSNNWDIKWMPNFFQWDEGPPCKITSNTIHSTWSVSCIIWIARLALLIQYDLFMMFLCVFSMERLIWKGRMERRHQTVINYTRSKQGYAKDCSLDCWKIETGQQSEQESTELFTHYKKMSVTGKIHESHMYFTGTWFWMDESWMHFDRSQTN